MAPAWQENRHRYNRVFYTRATAVCVIECVWKLLIYRCGMPRCDKDPTGGSPGGILPRHWHNGAAIDVTLQLVAWAWVFHAPLVRLVCWYRLLEVALGHLSKQVIRLSEEIIRLQSIHGPLMTL